MGIMAQKTATEITKYGLQAARTIASGYGKRSISRLAKDAIFQFPTIISADIDADDGITIIRAMEREYASFVMAVFSLNKEINRGKYNSTADFLRTFHQNSDIPAAVFNQGNVLLESATALIPGSMYVDPIMTYSLWDEATEAQFDTAVINDMYKPFTRTSRKLRDRIDIATEAGATSTPKVDVAKIMKENEQLKEKNKKIQQKLDQTPAQLTKKDSYNEKDAYEKSAIKTQAKKATEKLWGSSKDTQDMKNELAGYVKKNSPRAIGMGSNAPEIKQSEKYVALEPTLVKIDLVNYTDASVWTNSIMIGVKAMVRMVSSSQMIANMIEAAQDRAIFKMIKWNRGEYNLFDVLFGKKDYQKAGIEAAKGNWLAALKRRRVLDKASLLTGHRLMPTTTIIMTESEVEEVKRICSIDLHDFSNVRRLMNKYWLLGFAIYNTDNHILHAAFDGDDCFQDVSLHALVALTRKDTDMLNRPNSRHF